MKLAKVMFAAGIVAAGLFLCSQAQAAVQVTQVTIGASVTHVSATSVKCQWVVIQNNAAHNVRVGDSTTTSSIGILLLGSDFHGSFYQGPLPNGGYTDLSQFYLAGTQNDVIDVVCNQIN